MQAKSTENTIGSRLRRLVQLRGQSIREFSDATGIPYRTLQDYLGDKAKPGSEQLARIAAVGLDVNFILTGKIRRLGYLFFDTKPADDEAYYILSDAQVTEAIDRKSKEVISELLKAHLKTGEELTFENLLTTYLNLSASLADVFARSSPPLGDARKLGMPVGAIIDSILDATAQIAGTKLLVQAKAYETAARE